MRLQPAPKDSNIGFYLVMLAMLFEFGRPQDILPPLKVIPIPSLLDASILIAVLASGKSTFSNMQTKLWIGLLAFMALWVPFANNNFWALMTLKEMTLYFFFYLGIVTFVNTTSKMQMLIFMWLGVHAVLGGRLLLVVFSQKSYVADSWCLSRRAGACRCTSGVLGSH